MPKVLVVNSSGHDLTEAQKYGDLVIVSTDTVDKTNLHEMHRLISPFIAESTSEDYILQSGPTVMNMIISSMFAAKHKKINLLLWVSDARGRSRYIRRSLSFQP